jgi:outer membrane receptor for ferrienterochelin and colicin
VVLEAYKVESIREGQSKAINQQRAANTIKNIVSADAIGNLPDRTVGEALGRLPGINVVDDSKASIRGTAAQYNSVTLDGDRFTTSATPCLRRRRKPTIAPSISRSFPPRWSAASR